MKVGLKAVSSADLKVDWLAQSMVVTMVEWMVGRMAHKLVAKKAVSTVAPMDCLWAAYWAGMTVVLKVARKAD